MALKQVQTGLLNLRNRKMEGKMKPAVVMQSDFGIDSGLVACMHGVCKIVDPELEIHDITHTLPAFDIQAAD